MRKLLPLVSCHEAAQRPRPAQTQELPMVLLAIQELAARAATHDRHLQRGAQLAVAKTAS